VPVLPACVVQPLWRRQQRFGAPFGEMSRRRPGVTGNNKAPRGARGLLHFRQRGAWVRAAAMPRVLGDALGEGLVLVGLAQHVAAAPHGLDVVLAAGRDRELLAQLADEYVDDLEFGLVHAAIEMVEEHLLGEG